MTNADVIRSMTDDELKEFLSSFEQGDIDTARTFCDLCMSADNKPDCDECLKWWLENDCTAPQGLKYE